MDRMVWASSLGVTRLGFLLGGVPSVYDDPSILFDVLLGDETPPAGEAKDFSAVK